MTDNLALLAAATRPCPACGGPCAHGEVCGSFHSAIHACHTNPAYKRLPLPLYCTCGGACTVPLIPGLRDEHSESSWEGHYRSECRLIGCPGYTIVPEDTALRVLLEWLLKSEWPDGAGRRLQLGLVWRGLVCMIGPAASAVKTSGKTVLEALTAALVQALGLEVKRA